ncbi:MAG: outer membrane lipid asymmetry maintenance protein MlaD [Syntrophobacteraceae bacterium]
MDRKGLELGVGIFLLVGLLCLAYLSFNLGNIQWFGSGNYRVYAEFATVGGLKEQASVTMAGVQIGTVERISLKDGRALVSMSIHKDVQLEEDSSANIRTQGLIGDKYVSISPGASDKLLKTNGKIMDTQAPVDIEALLGKFVFGSVDKGKEKDKDTNKE